MTKIITIDFNWYIRVHAKVDLDTSIEIDRLFEFGNYGLLFLEHWNHSYSFISCKVGIPTGEVERFNERKAFRIQKELLN